MDVYLKLYMMHGGKRPKSWHMAILRIIDGVRPPPTRRLTTMGSENHMRLPFYILARFLVQFRTATDTQSDMGLRVATKTQMMEYGDTLWPFSSICNRFDPEMPKKK